MTDDKSLATDPGESQEEDRFKDMRSAKDWLQSIKDAKKYYETYNGKCDNIDKLYADVEKMASSSGEREFQIFWANIEVLKPAIYSRQPEPVVTARFKDRKPLVRHASELLERAIISSFETEDIHVTLKHVRDDLTINARGVPWLRYENDGEEERIAYDHVDRNDWVCQPARKWKECGWVARRSYLDRETMEGRFSESSPDWYKAEFKSDDEAEEDYAGSKKAAVWELWSKEKNLVVWVTEGVEDVLDISEPFLELENFYPCPRPAYGTLERGSLKPVPEFLYYKDQVEEINELTARISALSESLRLKGFYAGGAEDVSTAIEAAIKNTDNNSILIPVANFGALGGSSLKDAIIWLPVEQVAATIQQLVLLRKQLIEDVYEITGLSDIMRGSTDANETLGAQKLKSEYGSTRIKDRQGEMVRVARDCARIAGEIMAENFDPQTLLDMSQYDEVRSAQEVQGELQQIQGQIQQARNSPEIMQQAQQNPEQAQQMMQQAQQKMQELQEEVTLEQIFEFLRDQRMRPFVLDIETDSTIQPDEDAQKQRTTEFLAALSTALSQLGPMVQAQPQSASFAGEIIKFALAPYRAGRTLEAAVDEFIDGMKGQMGQEQPDPEAERAQAEQQAKMQEMQMKMQTEAAKQELEKQKIQIKMGEVQAKADAESQKLQLAMNDAQISSAQAQEDLEKTRAEIEKIFAEIEKIQADTGGVAVDAHVKMNPPKGVSYEDLHY